MSNVRLRSVQKRFGNVDVIHGININVDAGEFIALVGPSGCGKSTLLRMIAGLETISSGDIEIDGIIVNNKSPKDRNIAMVFQNYALYPHLTAKENIVFSLRLQKKSEAEVSEKLMKAAGILGLADLLERYPRQLSGGQRQRVAMGRAIVRNPAVFLFDEPLSNLDAKLRVSMRAEIKALHQLLRTTTVYVTHDQVEAMTMADRIVVMRDGLVEQVGTPFELYDYPANTFVAQFIGSPSMNILEGNVRSGVLHFNAGFDLPFSSKVDHAGPIAIGIRAEALEIGSEGIDVRVEFIEHTGAVTHIMARASDGQPISFVSQMRLPAKPGESMKLRPKPCSIHLFEQKSGNRVMAA